MTFSFLMTTTCSGLSQNSSLSYASGREVFTDNRQHVYARKEIKYMHTYAFVHLDLYIYKLHTFHAGCIFPVVFCSLAYCSLIYVLISYYPVNWWIDWYSHDCNWVTRFCLLYTCYKPVEIFISNINNRIHITCL